MPLNAKGVNEFLKEYKALCEKHSLIVSSCGCCNGTRVECLGEPYEGKDSIQRSVEELLENSLENVDFKHHLRSPYAVEKDSGVWDRVKEV